jgi:hypothetical protein
VILEVVDAAVLGHDDRFDAGAQLRVYLRVSDLGRADALAVVFDQDVGHCAPGHVAVALARPGAVRGG